MSKYTKITLVALGLGLLTGCEAFDRFEAWKMEALFGVPNPYDPPAPQGYYPGTQQPINYGAPTNYYYAQPTQPVQQPAYLPGQQVPPGYVLVVPQAGQQQYVQQPMVIQQPVTQQPAVAVPAVAPTPATQPQALLPPSAN